MGLLFYMATICKKDYTCQNVDIFSIMLNFKLQILEILIYVKYVSLKGKECTCIISILNIEKRHGKGSQVLMLQTVK